jgi:peptide-methionine (R)-S-oxide reductase
MGGKKVRKTDAEWKEELPPLQFNVTRKKATERPHKGKFTEHFEPGVYRCVCCGQELFHSSQKYDCGCGWPSFCAPVDRESLEQAVDRTHGMTRTEVLCSGCQAHLGHVFEDGPGKEGLRYCINSAALYFDPGGGADSPGDREDLDIDHLEEGEELEDWIEPEDKGLVEE